MVSIIIINYNTYDFTITCLRSIIAHTSGIPYEIILVDNHSTECDPQVFKQLFPQITLVISPENGGFAKGNNLGISLARGSIILLLNSDTQLTEDAISKAARLLQQRPEIGVLGVTLKYPDGRIQHYTRRFRSITLELLDLARPLLHLLPYRRRATLMLNQYYSGDFDMTADWIGGAFFMFPASLLQQLPGRQLDDRFFMYGEDQLWCYQISQLGYQCFNYSGTSVIHFEGGSGRGKQKKPRFQPNILERDLLIYRLRGADTMHYTVLKAVYFTKKYIAYLLKLARYHIKK